METGLGAQPIRPAPASADCPTRLAWNLTQPAVSQSNRYDLAETLYCLSGKQIKRITADSVEFADGSTASLSAPDWATVKPLIWW